MDVALRTDFCGNDLGRVREYAIKLGLRDVWAFPEVKECYAESGLMDLERLKRYQQGFTENGLALRLLTETIDEESLLSPGAAKEKANVICHTINAMGKAEHSINILILKEGLQECAVGLRIAVSEASGQCVHRVFNGDPGGREALYFFFGLF